MTWTKLPAEFYDDNLMLSVSRSARLLHIEALTWSNRQGADGVVPANRLGRITDAPDAVALADELVDAGIWSPGEDGYSIVANLKDQPTADDVERTAVQVAERQRRQRQHRGGDHSLCSDRYCNERRKQLREQQSRDESPVQSRDASRVTDEVSHDYRTGPSRAAKAGARKGGKAVAEEAPTPVPSFDTTTTSYAECMRCRKPVSPGHEFHAECQPIEQTLELAAVGS